MAYPTLITRPGHVVIVGEYYCWKLLYHGQRNNYAMMQMKKRTFLPPLFLLGALIAIYTQFTIFVVPPVGSMRNGMTIIFPRLGDSGFIDSPDAMCERKTGRSSLLCRGTTVGAVAARARIVARLPYSEVLYTLSVQNYARWGQG